MRAEVYVFNAIKGFILKIRGIRNLFFKIESYLFDVFKIFNLRRYFGKNLRDSNGPNEKLILKFKKFYEMNYFDEKINTIFFNNRIEYSDVSSPKIIILLTFLHLLMSNLSICLDTHQILNIIIFFN